MRGKGLLLVSLFFLDACGGGGGGASSSVVSKVVISPRPLAVQKGTPVQLTASATDPSGNPISQPGLTWSVDGGLGTITSGGLYSAPSTIPSQNQVTVRVTSNSDPSKNDAISFYILTGQTLSFPPLSLDITAAINPAGTPPDFRMKVFNQNIYLTWVTTSQPAGTRLLYAKMDMNGNFLTLPHDIFRDIQRYLPGSGLSGKTIENPDIALDNNGEVYVAWDDNTNTSIQIGIVKGGDSISSDCPVPPCFTAFALTGAAQTTSLYIEPNQSAQQNVSIFYNPLGSIAFAWTETYSASTPFISGTYITYKELKLDGAAPNPSFPISTLISPNIQTNPQIGVDHSGNISVAWVDYGSGVPLLNYSRGISGQSNSNFGLAKEVETASLTSNDTLSMILDDSGYPYFAWSNSKSGTKGIHYSTTSDFSSFLNPPGSLSLSGLKPSVKIDLLNNLYAAWEDSGQIYFEKFHSGSMPASGPSPPITTGLTSSLLNAVMDIDTAGRVYLLFSTSSSTGLSTFFLRGE